MREIKFRQFIGGKMQYWGFIEGAFFGPSSNGADGKNPQNTPHMQYTGLKDKNGKEIYEGDVLECRTPKMDFTFRSEIRLGWSAGGVYGWHWMRNGLDGSAVIEVDGISERMEIIGNIYQNPDLLK